MMYGPCLNIFIQPINLSLAPGHPDTAYVFRDIMIMYAPSMVEGEACREYKSQSKSTTITSTRTF
jgi:hypothetical protein